jgi:hypothetical protein
MSKWKLAAPLLCGLALTACGNSEDAATVYVLIPLSKAAPAETAGTSGFTQDLAAISKRHGLAPNPGKSVDDKGHAFYVLEAKGNSVRLWSTNMPLSGQENPALCGRHSEPHADPGQYTITIDHSLPLIGKTQPRKLISEISKELKTAGYEVRPSPVECSPLSKSDARGAG